MDLLFILHVLIISALNQSIQFNLAPVEMPTCHTLFYIHQRDLHENKAAITGVCFVTVKSAPLQFNRSGFTLLMYNTVGTKMLMG